MMVMVLYLIHVHFSPWQLVNSVKVIIDENNILFLGEGPASSTAKYPVDITRSKKITCLSLL